MLIKLTSDHSGFLTLWILLTFSGFLTSLYWIEIGERPDIGLLEGLLGGAIAGTFQGFALKPLLRRPWGWAIATMIAWGLLGWSELGALGWVAPRDFDLYTRLFYGLVDGVKMGLVLGIIQGLALKRRSNVLQWLVTSTIAWSISLTLSWLLGGVLRLLTGLFIGDVIGLTVGWLVMASLTGFSLVRMTSER